MTTENEKRGERESVERGMLFSAPMVRALLDGSKTQTRRIAKGEPTFAHINGQRVPVVTSEGNGYLCPYGQPGDRIWVRETWSHENYPYGPADPDCCFFYRVDYFDDPLGPDLELSQDGIRRKWIPSIHMPRFASRIDLEITGVRVEQLQDISEADAKAEGASFHDGRGIGHSGYRHDVNSGFVWGTAKESYRHLWKSINGTGSWNENPWVWVIDFKVVPPSTPTP